MEALQGVQKQLSDLSAKHLAEDTDDKELKQLIGYLKQWETGTNTGGASAGNGAAPVVALSAPAGIGMASQENIAIGAQTHVDVVSVGNTQLSVGKKLRARVSEGISLFAHSLGIKLIAASGKLDIQTHSDDIEVTSAKRIVLTAADEIVLQAPKVRLVTQGAQADFGGGAITQQSSGAHTIKSSKFAHVGGGGGNVPGLELPTSAMQTDEKFVLARRGSGRPQRYRIELDDGRVIEGVTDRQGHTELTQDKALKIARLTLLKD
jgi:type VI secretion system secreted protein VgrG